jgi:hypothetical protein
LLWREWEARLADPLDGVDAWWNSAAAAIADPVRLLALRHQAWGAASQSCGSVSLPRDAAVE